MSWKTYVLTEDSQDEGAFDAFVSSHPKGDILQSFAWGQVKKHTGWKPFPILVRDDNGKAIASALVLCREIPGIRRSILYCPRGPVVDFENLEQARYLFGEIVKLGRAQKAIMLKIDPDIPADHDLVRQNLKTIGFQPSKNDQGFEGTQPRFVFRLDITPSLDELMASFHSKTRYNIRLAARKGVSIKTVCNQEDLKVFYGILLETANRDRFLVRNYDYFVTLWKELVERGYANLFMAYYQDQPVAGTLAFTMGSKAWYLYGASSNEHRNVMPNYLLQWEMIKWAKGRGCTMYDFRGISGDLDPKNPLYGLYRFKRGFGGSMVEFIGDYDLVLSKGWYIFWSEARPAYSKIVRKIAPVMRRFRPQSTATGRKDACSPGAEV